MFAYERNTSPKPQKGPAFVPFAEVLSHLKRGEWVYALMLGNELSPELKIVFGSIQAIDFSKKALLIGVDIAPGHLVWIPEWYIFSNSDYVMEFCRQALVPESELKYIEEFIKKNESKDWVQSLRKND